MESYLNENFDLQVKNSSEEAPQRWRKLWIVKNKNRRFRFTANLSKPFEAEAIRRSHQEKLRVAVLVSQAALEFIPSLTEHRTGLGQCLRHHGSGWVEWTFLLTSLCLEILSIAFDQASSPSKPQYALFGMILAIAAVLVCIWELIYNCKKVKVELRRWGRLWWFYYPHSTRLFGTLPDFYGLIGSISQCICSTVQYVCFSRHANNPIKVSLWPAIFLVCLGAKRLAEDRIETRDEHRD